MLKQRKAAVIGAGGWGTALSTVLSYNFKRVDLWVREEDVLADIISLRENKTFLPGVALADNILPSRDLKTVLVDAEIAILAVPSAYVRQTLSLIENVIDSETILVIAGKGFDPESKERLSQVAMSVLHNNPIAVVSGPNHAEETGKKVPSATVVAANEESIALAVQEALMTPFLRVYTNSDMVGVEIGGALKNIIALATGICDGLGYGDNTKAALMTRGLTEISRLGQMMGARSITFAGLSGVGDLIVTCTSMHSRNRRCGIAIGKGQSLDSYLQQTKMVVEGVNACRAAYYLSEKYQVCMPIVEVLYGILFNGLKPKDAVIQLMTRTKKHEIEDISF